MDPLSQVFCLRWNNHRNNLLTVLEQLLQTEAFCDVTLACDNTSIKCHKMILSACSSYFQTLFMENTCEHPIVFLKDIKYAEIRAILDYMYKGEVNVAQEELPGLLKVAELLRVKGLVEEEREKLLNSSSKNDRPSTTSGDATTSSKLNGPSSEPNSRDASRDRSTASERERERERDREHHRERVASASDQERRGSVASENAAVLNHVREREREREDRGGLKDSPFMLTPPNPANFPLFPLPGLPIPGVHNLFGANGPRPPMGGLDRGREDGGGDSANEREGSPSPGGASKRRKVASGSGGSSSSKESGHGHRDGEPPLNMDLDKAHDLDKEGMMGMPPGMDKSGIANYVPNQRLEWKRYKQYTRNDIMSAIEAVKSGMSALQASRKFGVPSRTLYDKVKKMGITTGRQVQQRKSLPQYPSSFPGALGGMLNLSHDAYKDMEDRDDTNDSSLGGPGDVLDGRATMVPPSGLSTLHMLNIMKGMKESESGRDKGEGEVSLRPINLSTMLGSHHRGRSPPSSAADQHAANNKRHSESSLSPRSPRPHHRDLEDDIVADSSGGRGGRHPSGEGGGLDAASELREQFLNDLRRIGAHAQAAAAGATSNIPTQSSSAGNGEHQAASSTTTSPPPLQPRARTPNSGGESGSGSGSLQTSPTKSADDSLPPRKRKVSQEHHHAAASKSQRSPFNGIHEAAAGEAGGEKDRGSSEENSKDEPTTSVH